MVIEYNSLLFITSIFEELVVKYLLPVGMFTGVLALTLPQLLAIQSESSLADPASLGLLAVGLLALGMAKKQQDKSDN